MRYIFCFMILFLVGCATADPDLFPDDISQRDIPVYVVDHGRHAGIAIPVNDIFLEIMPDGLHISSENWAEIGWGDRRFYMERRTGIGSAIRAALWPTSSVIQVATNDDTVVNSFGRAEIIQVKITEDGYRKLLERIVQTLKTDSDGRVIQLENGLYLNAMFYDADRRYTVFRNSNHYTARLLREAGAPVNMWYAFTSSNVMRQSKRFGEQVNP